MPFLCLGAENTFPLRQKNDAFKLTCHRQRKILFELSIIIRQKCMTKTYKAISLLVNAVMLIMSFLAQIN